MLIVVMEIGICGETEESLREVRRAEDDVTVL